MTNVLIIAKNTMEYSSTIVLNNMTILGVGRFFYLQDNANRK